MVLTHEVEHSYQYLIGKEVVPASCKMLQQGYKCLSELLVPKDYILPRPIKQVRRVISVISYKRRENEFLLETNKMKVKFVRHGETVWNKEKREQNLRGE